jgi:hypothetical protein
VDTIIIKTEPEELNTTIIHTRVSKNISQQSLEKNTEKYDHSNIDTAPKPHRMPSCNR